MKRASLRFAAAALASATLLAGAPQQSPPAQGQQPPRPIFRAGAHFVRVDAYPSRDGRIIEGLTKDAFEVFEDGRPQDLQTFEYIDFSAPTPEAERRDPNSQRDAFNLAADPRYRVFVLYLDVYHVGVSGSHASRRPIVDLLNRILGARDLFGVLTPRQIPMRDLLLGQQTLSIEEQLARHWTWGAQGSIEREPEELMLEACFPEVPHGTLAARLISRRRLDKVFSDLEEIVTILGGLREERKNVILFSRGWGLPGSDLTLAPARPRPVPPVGITNAGKLTLGAKGTPGSFDTRICDEELARLPGIDFDRRHRDLLVLARRANVTFYPVNPEGLEAAATASGMDDITYRMDRLTELAENTDGVAITNTNNLHTGLQRVAGDLSGMYVLGYYTSNTRWDGAPRKISVRLRGSGDAVRARREYRAPTEAEMALLRNPPAAAKAAAPSAADEALGLLARMRPGAVVHAYGRVAGTEIAIVAEIASARVEAGRWKSGGEVQAMVTTQSGDVVGTARAKIPPGGRAALLRLPTGGQSGPYEAVVRVRGEGEEPEEDHLAIAPSTGRLLGDPLVHRSAPAAGSALHPAAGFQFRRTERVVIEWPLGAPVDRRTARLLGRDGKPLPLEVALSETPGAGLLVVQLNLAPLTAGDYLVELTAGAGDAEERRLLAIRVVR